MNNSSTTQLEISRLLARGELCELEPKELIDWATSMLVREEVTPALCILAGLSDQESSEVHDYFGKALRELGVSRPERKKCLLGYAGDVAKRVVRSEIKPSEGYWQIQGIVRELRYPAELRCWMDLECDLDVLEYAGQSSEEKVDEHIRSCALEFLDVLSDWEVTGTFRLNLEHSLKRLLKLDLVSKTLTASVPERARIVDGSAPWISLFRTRLEKLMLNDLTLPRVLVSRSELQGVAFRNSDLTQGTLCWNDFNSCDFSHAVMAGADLRRSIFRQCSFYRADLTNADLRGVSFEACSFTSARMVGARLEKRFGLSARLRAKELRLSEEQTKSVAWTRSRGEEPVGG